MIATAAEIQALAYQAIREYDAAIDAQPEGPARGKLAQERWKLLRLLGQFGQYFSEAGQDEFLDRAVFGQAQGGTFVEIGAFDGITGSNTLFFERSRNWTGLLVEAAPSLCAEIPRHRASPVVNFAVGPESGVTQFLEVSAGYRQMGGILSSLSEMGRYSIANDPRTVSQVIEVAMIGLAELLAVHGMRDIDYVSIDIEGGERAALAAFPFDDFNIRAWSIEVNEGGIDEIMAPAGYALAAHIGADQIWIRP